LDTDNDNKEDNNGSHEEEIQEESKKMQNKKGKPHMTKNFRRDKKFKEPSMSKSTFCKKCVAMLQVRSRSKQQMLIGIVSRIINMCTIGK
jgi:RNase P subunit RPR2